MASCCGCFSTSPAVARRNVKQEDNVVLPGPARRSCRAHHLSSGRPNVMTRRLAAASCTSHQRPKFVWISDALLSDTFNRFWHHKRYGSSVPGPLEAQRRAAKRKNTSLAYASSGGAAIDPAVVLASSANKLAWWGEPKDAGAASGMISDLLWRCLADTPIARSSRLLPAWLFPFPASTKAPDPNPARLEVESWMSHPRAMSDQQAQGLSHCQTLSDIKTWLMDEQLSLTADAHVGSAILTHIVEKNSVDLDVHTIAAYISDPAFHPPGSSFILDLVRAIVPRPWDRTAWSIFRRSICSATELGLISLDDTRQIIDEVLATTSLQLTNVPWKNKRNRAKMYLVCGILEAMDRSAVLEVTDLGASMLSKLFSRFKAQARLKWCKKMAWRLLPWSSKKDVPFIGLLIHQQLQFQRGQRASGVRHGQALADRLIQADPETLQLLLAHTTEILLDFTKKTQTMLHRFMWHHWCGTLAVLGSRNHHGSLSKHTWDSLQSVKSTLSPDQRLLAFAWTAMALCHDMRTSPDLSNRLWFLSFFEGLIASISSLRMDSSRLAVVEFSTLALPFRDLLLRHLTQLSDFCEDSFFGRDSQPLPTIDSTRRQGITTSIVDRRIQNAHFAQGDALSEILNSASHGFQAFKVLARRMVRKSTMSFGIVCHLLERNAMVKKVLEMPQSSLPSLYGTAGVRDGELIDIGASTVPERMTSRSEPPTTASSPPTREDIVDLFHDLAISFATSPVATPRAAFRRVYWCYLFLCQHGVLIQPPITRALWHAGVTRYGEQGTPATLLNWILARVSMVEGGDVARQLIWSATFRRSRTEQIEAITRPHQQDEQAMLASLCRDAAETPSNREHETNGPTITTGSEADCSSSASSSAGAGAGASARAGLGPFSESMIASQLTGDEEVDRETKAKIKFLQSLPPERPIWSPREKTRGGWKGRDSEAAVSHSARQGHKHKMNDRNSGEFRSESQVKTNVKTRRRVFVNVRARKPGEVSIWYYKLPRLEPKPGEVPIRYYKL
ncbi:hypothetical protein CLCR_09520 [Cladophialophora carrionii]|uniref:Uncharacterized protein n=1 Tax=Cladophialophora carrionii TaxID=86049 RepID=A0A1C1CYF6_9EURO|nr:hypothetical protein CLCR_09520 [Cladophialophora carrionii]